MKRYRHMLMVRPPIPRVFCVMERRFTSGPYHKLTSTMSIEVSTMKSQAPVMVKMVGMNPAAAVLTGMAMIPAPTVDPAIRRMAPSTRPDLGNFAVSIPTMQSRSLLASSTGICMPSAPQLNEAFGPPTALQNLEVRIMCELKAFLMS